MQEDGDVCLDADQRVAKGTEMTDRSPRKCQWTTYFGAHFAIFLASRKSYI